MYKEEYEAMVEPYQLKALRESYGVSVSEISKHTSLSFETIKRIEHTSTRLNTVEGGKVRYKKQTYDEYRRALINYVSNMRFDGRRFDQKVIFRNLKAYCNEIGITLRDFCLANELNFKFFEHPLTIPGIESILRHNTNWTMDDLEFGIKVPKKEEEATITQSNDIPHEKILEVINNYCATSGITKKELGLMCDIGETGFAPFFVRRYTESKIQKILNATGWTKEQLYGLEPIIEKTKVELIKDLKKEVPKTELKHIPLEKDGLQEKFHSERERLGDFNVPDRRVLIDEPEPSYVNRALVKDINDEPRKDILQYKGEFTYEDRKKQTPKQYRVINNSDGTKDYVCEWDVIQVRHMVKHLSREDFLKEV